MPFNVRPVNLHFEYKGLTVRTWLEGKGVYLGKKEGNRLVYKGKVGTDWSRTVSSEIRKKLETVVTPKTQLSKVLKKPSATWVEPRFYAEVEYRDITSEGLLRASSFKGLKKL